MQHSGKIKFPNVDKKINTIPLKSKIGVDSFQNQNTTSSRVNDIQTYYNQLSNISNSKVGSKSGKIFTKAEIDNIYKKIFDTPIPKGDDGNKNNLIDRIVKFYSFEYVHRDSQSMSSTAVGNVDTFINTSIQQPKIFNSLDYKEEEDFY